MSDAFTCSLESHEEDRAVSQRWEGTGFFLGHRERQAGLSLSAVGGAHGRGSLGSEAWAAAPLVTGRLWKPRMRGRHDANPPVGRRAEEEK